MRRLIACLMLTTLGLVGPAAPTVAQQRVVPDSKAEALLSFSPVVKQVTPAVVNIYTKTVVKTRSPLSPLFNDPFFRRFFGDQVPRGGTRERVETSLGSGVIVREDGIVVTNDHVIAGASEITVILADRREFEAEVLGTDERTDLAVLRLETDGETLPTLPLTDSDALEVGDLVLAVGNPFGVGQTTTMGIVSALGRTTGGGDSQHDFRSFIQTDAAINPGNSGGALVDGAGRLVGINTAIYSRDGGNVGIGFAIPSNMVRVTVDSLISEGRAVRPWFGAGGQGVTNDIAQSLGMERPVGVLINEIYPGGPADRAGLKVGDVVVAAGGLPVVGPADLRYRIVTAPLGEGLDLTVRRADGERVVRVALIPPPEDPPRNVTRLERFDGPFEGAEVANLNPALAEEMGLDSLQRGVVVLALKRGGTAARLGFRPGDIITRVNDRDTPTIKDLQRAVRPTVRWTITLLRDGRSLTTTLSQ
ncbi:Trypsin-like serine protease [Caenispirillum salinarum AK4]|uniref:Trypsin-like serine protease n=1 Tax=Caenispirillum salinarum AK4 TaxID=1238182 RepID=K9HL36_9PROT|nr:DegQ family serine endoprotease [Caenispirillum salinarum]EKV29281.1 Trypsin-like serine protease [Caenispirillum salinarum AK4]